MPKIRKQNSGFTLLETLVALSIFSFSIVGLIVITSQGVANANFSKNKLAASYLAQEGIELIRNIRDNGIVGGDDWSSFINVVGPCIGGDCLLDARNPTPVTCAVPDCRGAGEELLYDKNTGFFNHDFPASNDNVLSSFTRSIKVNQISGYEAEIVVKVFWRQGNRDEEVVLTENLFDWF